MIRSVFAILIAVMISSTMAAAAEDSPQAEALSTMDAQCRAEGGEAENCTCLREAFRKEVIDKASSSQVALFAARAYAGGEGDRKAMLRAVQSMSPEQLQEVGVLASALAPAAEACMEIETEAETKSNDLPQGEGPRARFIRHCARENGQAALCGCIADQVEDELSPFEFELMGEMIAAEEEGEDPVETIARERELSEQEVQEGLAAATGGIAASMMTVDPLSCAGSLK